MLRRRRWIPLEEPEEAKREGMKSREICTFKRKNMKNPVSYVKSDCKRGIRVKFRVLLFFLRDRGVVPPEILSQVTR